MRIGFVELLLILLIASLTIGPSAALWVDRWLRRANRASAAAARRRAVQEAQRAAEREEVLQRFQKLSIVFTLAAVAALVWALVLRPIEAPPKTYTAPDHRQASGAAQAALSTDRREIWDLGGYQGVDCIRTRDGLVYAAAWNGFSLKKRTSDLVRTDGGNAAVILSVEGELTGFAFDAAGDLWLTVLTPAGGTLCRARHDSWGASVEQVVTQIDGAPLGALSAVEVGEDGKVYFAVVGQESAEQGLESALRTALLAHTGTGAVYVYDPAARTVEQVVGGIAGASGLALDERTQTLYISDLGSRCIWSAAASARSLTAGGKGCQSSFSGLPGYPGTLALDEDSTLYISYRWASSSWLERHAGSTFLRGVALRLSESMQENLFSLPADGIRAEVIKYGVLYDPKLFAHLEEKGLSFDREAVITRCVELKRDVVMEDEFDTGARMKLNLGHTVGHGVEAKSHFAISHGKAVAIGMAIVSRASACADTPRIAALLEQFGLPTRTDYSADDLFSYTLSDKKRSGGTVNLIIPRAIGDCAIVPTKVESLKSFIQAGL